MFSFWYGTTNKVNTIFFGSSSKSLNRRAVGNSLCIFRKIVGSIGRVETLLTDAIPIIKGELEVR